VTPDLDHSKTFGSPCVAANLVPIPLDSLDCVNGTFGCSVNLFSLDSCLKLLVQPKTCAYKELWLG
jgi:hypothetical protein